MQPERRPDPNTAHTAPGVSGGAQGHAGFQKAARRPVPPAKTKTSSGPGQQLRHKAAQSPFTELGAHPARTDTALAQGRLAWVTSSQLCMKASRIWGFRNCLLCLFYRCILFQVTTEDKFSMVPEVTHKSAPIQERPHCWDFSVPGHEPALAQSA